jgi:16S rRNA (cytidine1402-2'-O)-methyltransferase
VDYILCEDTRRAQKLKSRFQLSPKLVSFHEHNERKRIPKILAKMNEGKTFALISDAGSPLISDPGLNLTRKMREASIPFTCIPGPSAVTTALALSAFQPEPFTFVGFLPASASARRKEIEGLRLYSEHTIVLFEAPHRILGLLREIGEVLGDREIALCREMTKVHEEVLRGRISELLPALATRKLQGEFTIVIAAGESPSVTMSEDAIRKRFAQLQTEGVSRKEALKKLSKESGRSRNDLYRMLME